MMVPVHLPNKHLKRMRFLLNWELCSSDSNLFDVDDEAPGKLWDSCKLNVHACCLHSYAGQNCYPSIWPALPPPPITPAFFSGSMNAHTYIYAHPELIFNPRSSLWRQEEVPIKIKISSFNGLLNWQLNNDFRIGICQRSRKILSW